MCCSCSVKAKKFWLWGSAITALVLAVVLGVLWSTIFGAVLSNMLVLKEGSLTYDNWIKTPLPMFAEFYMFNWTNPHEVRDPTTKPNFVEMGPYVFEEVHTRDGVMFYPNSTVAFNQTRTWQFRPELSNGTLDDKITNLNTIAMAVGYGLRYEPKLMQIIGDALLDWDHAELTITKSIRELIFDGYDEKILQLMHKLHLKQFPIPFTKFGWFVDRNASSSYDGRFHMHTGEDDIKNLGLLQLWNYEDRTNSYSGDCSKVRGTTGELWPPETDTELPLEMFVTDICRSIKLRYQTEGSKFDIDAQKYRADEHFLDNGQKYEENKCFCTADHCPDLPSGVMNVSSCKFGAPAFLSFPHFYMADDSYRDAIDGMKPDETQHEFYLLMQRSLGIPLEVRAGLQINLLMEEYFPEGIFKGLPRIMMPMFWFQQKADITEELAKSAYWAAKATDIATYTVFIVGGLAVLVMVFGVYLSMTNNWTRNRTDDVDELLTDHHTPPGGHDGIAR